MKRRAFMTILGGTVAAWPIAARGQQPGLQVIGFLNSGVPNVFAQQLAGFRKGLGEAGYVEDQNVTIEFRWAEGQYERLPALAADLVRRRVGIIVATGGSPSGLAAKKATTTIPIVFIIGGDPVKLGLVTSLNRPGGNATGVSVCATSSLEGKRLGLMRELVSTATTIAVLLNPNSPEFEAATKDLQSSAFAVGQTIHIMNASGERDLDAVFATIVQKRIGALIVADNANFNNWRGQLIALAAHYSVPTIYSSSSFAVSGGLISYGPNFAEVYRQAGVYAAKILKGRSTGRPTRRTIEQIRAGDQSQDCEGARPRHSTGNTRYRRRGDRIDRSTSGVGTERTCRPH
jgi:putative tryptophan/tyrosine transport system substrate-binding protein